MTPSRDSCLRLAVVGHTNTGKTSLLRTLTRDPEFGQVMDSPGTTRHVEGVRLLARGQPMVELFDTPGIEDGMGLLDYLDQLSQRSERLDGPERLKRFLDSPESTRRFEQEARVLRKLLDCDAGLYVIDVRDPVLSKHKDELAVLAHCGRPLLPVLNFVHSHAQRTDEWRTALARLNLHAVAEFDTVAPPLDGEAQLYDKLALLLDTRAPQLQALKDDIAEQRAVRRADAARLIAELLIDAAAFRISSPPNEHQLAQATETLRRTICERENACVRALLKRYNFRPGDVSSPALPLEGERWGMDLFHPQALKDAGLHLGKGAAAGAVAGATLDMFTAGLSLGAATLIGAAAGGLWQGADRYGKRLAGRLKGFQELSVDDAVLCLLALRQIALAHALERRGHAAQTPIELDPASEAMAAQASAKADSAGQGPVYNSPKSTLAADLRKGRLPAVLHEARSQPLWSSLTGPHYAGQRREQAIVQLVSRLLDSAR